MFCTKCGTEIENNAQACPNCGTRLSGTNNNTPSSENKARCLPSFILGLIGSIFGILGGMCTMACSFGGGNNIFFLIIGGSVISLIGACLCLSKPKLGSILETVGTLMIIYRGYFKGGFEYMTTIAMVFLVFGSLIGLVYAFLIKRK